MSEPVAALGSALLLAAMAPQAIRLVRTRRAGDFHPAFAALNAAGLALLAWRARDLREWAFVAVNVAGVAFWIGVLLIRSHPYLRGSLSAAPEKSPHEAQGLARPP